MKRVKLLSLITLFCTSTVSVFAQTSLASWTFNVSAGPSPFPPASSDANVTVGGLTRASGVTAPASGAAALTWGGVNWNDGLDPATQSITTALSNNNYFTFTLTANSGYSESLSNIASYNIRRSGTGPDSMMWQYSLNATDFTNIGDVIYAGSGTTGPGNVKPAIDLSGIASLQNVAAGTTVTFRLVAWHATSDAGTFYFNGNATAGLPLTLNGVVTPSTPLPLNLISFKGQQAQNANHLAWVTAQEKYVSHFELERGTDGSSFSKIADINSALKTDNGTDINYSYDDKNAPAISFYRLKIVEVGGAATYSDVVVLRNGASQNKIQLYPNPAEGTLFVEGLNGVSSYRITDAMGREVVPASTFNSDISNIKSINVSTLVQGIYFIQLKDESGMETIRFVKK